MSSLQTDADVLRFFRESVTPIYFVNATAFNLLGAEDWIGGLSHINAVDSFDGRHPGAFVPNGLPPDCLNDIPTCNNELLRNRSVARHVQERPPGKALFLMFDAETERLAARLGLEVCFPPASLRNHLDSKLTATRLATEAGVASVPHALARVTDYASLRIAARELGPDLVIQLPHGDSGTTTFFVSDADDFLACAGAVAAEREVKVMRRIRCRPMTIEACVTRHGTLVGPLMSELTGDPALTPFRGGWCGNELTPERPGPELRARAQGATIALGHRLSRAGYRGCFGLDFLLDEDTGRLYLGELNPRITGVTPLTSQALLEAGRAPLLLYHLLEWLGVDYRVDVRDFNEHQLAAPRAGDWGQLVIEQTGDAQVVTGSPASGIWRLAVNGDVSLLRSEFSLGSIATGEALFLRTVEPGRPVPPGRSIGRLITRDRVLTDGVQLSPRAEAWVRGFRRAFARPALRELLAGAQ